MQCSQCLLYRNQGIINCICGQFLVESGSRRKFNKLRLDALSIPHYVIKKGRCHGARHGKTEELKEYVLGVIVDVLIGHDKVLVIYVAIFVVIFCIWRCTLYRMRGRDAAKELTLKVNFSKHRFLTDQVHRESQLAIGWTEQKCTEMDELAKQNHTNHLFTEEFQRYLGQWYLTWNKSGKNAPMRLRPDFRAAVSLKNRLHRESGEQVAEPISPQQYRRWHSSSSDSWWDTSEWSWWSS